MATRLNSELLSLMNFSNTAGEECHGWNKEGSFSVSFIHEEVSFSFRFDFNSFSVCKQTYSSSAVIWEKKSFAQIC